MSQPQDPENAAPPPPVNQIPPAPPTTQLGPPRRSCGSRILGFIGWILTIALSVLLALAAAAALLFYFFGIDLATPDQIRRASSDVAALQQEAQALQTEVALLRTAEAERASELSGARERIDELERLAGDLSSQAATAAALGQELNENVALAATIQAEGREGQVLVAVVATVQAGNTDRLDELQRRTDRLVRFLQRLSDIAGDATLDESPVATPTLTPAGTPEPTAEPDINTVTTPTPAGTPEPSATP